MFIYSEMEPTTNIVRDEEPAVYHRIPWWRRNICRLTIRRIHLFSTDSISCLSKQIDTELYSLDIHLWLNDNSNIK